MYDSIVNLGEWQGNRGPSRPKGWHDHLRLAGDLRYPADRQRGRLYPAARPQWQAVLYGYQLHQDAQPDQRVAGIRRQVAPRRLFGLFDGARRRYWPGHDDVAQ